MPRPKSSTRGGRVTPKGTRPGHRDCGGRPRPRLTPEEVLLRDAAQNFGECADLDGAETMASSMLMMFRPLPPDEAPTLDASRVLTAAQAHTDPTAAAEVVAALGAYGPPGQRRRARGLLARLIDGGASVPEWIGSLGDVEPRRAVVMADGWGEERILWIDFERPDREVRGIGMRVNAMEAGYAHGFLYGPAIADLAGTVETDVQGTVREISLADARAMALWGLELRDMIWDGDDLDDEDAELVGDEELRALIDQRIGLLPSGGAPPFDEPLTEDEVDDLCAEFVASRSSSPCDEPIDVDDAQWLVDDVCWFARSLCDGDPLRWSPPRVGLYLTAWIPEMALCDDEAHDAVESVFPRWLRFAAERRGLAEDLLEMNLAAARESFSTMRANSSDPSKRSAVAKILAGMLADDLDLDDEAAVQDWIDAHNARARAERLPAPLPFS